MLYWDYSRKCSPHPERLDNPERLDKWVTRSKLMDTTSTAGPGAGDAAAAADAPQTTCDLEDWEDLKELFAKAAEIYESACAAAARRSPDKLTDGCVCRRAPEGGDAAAARRDPRVPSVHADVLRPVGGVCADAPAGRCAPCAADAARPARWTRLARRPPAAVPAPAPGERAARQGQGAAGRGGGEEKMVSPPPLRPLLPCDLFIEIAPQQVQGSARRRSTRSSGRRCSSSGTSSTRTPRSPRRGGGPPDAVLARRHRRVRDRGEPAYPHERARVPRRPGGLAHGDHLGPHARVPHARGAREGEGRRRGVC